MNLFGSLHHPREFIYMYEHIKLAKILLRLISFFSFLMIFSKDKHIILTEDFTRLETLQYLMLFPKTVYTYILNVTHSS